MLKYLLFIAIPFTCFSDEIDNGDECYDRFQEDFREVEIEGLHDLKQIDGSLFMALNKFVFYWAGHYWIVNQADHFKYCECENAIEKR